MVICGQKRRRKPLEGETFFEDADWKFSFIAVFSSQEHKSWFHAIATWIDVNIPLYWNKRSFYRFSVIESEKGLAAQHMIKGLSREDRHLPPKRKAPKNMDARSAQFVSLRDYPLPG